MAATNPRSLPTQFTAPAKAIELAAMLEEQATSEKIRISELPEFDMVEHLSDEQAIAEYLTIVDRRKRRIPAGGSAKRHARARVA